MTVKAKSKTLSRQQELMRGLNITEEDIAVNRLGQISMMQREKILLQHKEKVIILALSAVGLLVLAIYTFTVFADEGKTNYSTTLAILFGIGLVIEMIVMVVVGKLGRDVKEGLVETVQGLAIVTSNRQKIYSLSVNDIRFKMPQAAILYIKHLEPHVIYYLPKTKMIVAVEVMES